MTPEYLKYFITVYHCGGIQKAARELFVSPQGISQGLQRLEKSVGLPLFERTSNGVIPTEFGRLYYEQAVIVLREMNKLDQLSGSYSSARRSQIRIATVGLNKFFISLLDSANEYTRIYPDRALELHTETFSEDKDVFNGLRKGTLDMGLLFHLETLPEFTYYTLNPFSPLVLLVSRDSLASRSACVDWDELRDHRFIFPSPQDSFTNCLMHLCEQHHIKPDHIIYSTETGYICDLIDRDLACIILRESYMHHVLDSCKNATALHFREELRAAGSLVTGSTAAENSAVSELIHFMIPNLREHIDF